MSSPRTRTRPGTRPTSLRRTARLIRTGPLALALAAALLVAPCAVATQAAAATAAQSQEDGVTVVVDFTDLGGRIEVGFAPGDPGTGREALENAGFSPTDAIPGMVCAIDSMPDPCPEEFDGSFWSYWTATDGQWQAHAAGADGTDPAPGDVEGWRYYDGSSGPQITPDEVQAQVADGEGGAGDDGTGAEGGEEADDEGPDGGTGSDETDPGTDGTETDTDTDAADGAGDTIWAVLALAVIAVAIVLALWLRRRRQPDHRTEQQG